MDGDQVISRLLSRVEMIHRLREMQLGKRLLMWTLYSDSMICLFCYAYLVLIYLGVLRPGPDWLVALTWISTTVTVIFGSIVMWIGGECTRDEINGVPSSSPSVSGLDPADAILRSFRVNRPS